MSQHQNATTETETETEIDDSILMLPPPGMMPTLGAGYLRGVLVSPPHDKKDFCLIGIGGVL